MKFGIGQAVSRREDDRLLTGQGRFVDDLSFPDELHLAFVRSPYPHARIRSIDATEAKSIAGVAAVCTGAELVADGVGSFPGNPALKNSAGKPMSGPPLFPLATDTVRFVGQTVAAVAATSRAIAQRAAETIVVDYEPLDAVATLQRALAPDAPPLWPDAPGNAVAVSKWGDEAACDAAFARAAHVTRLSLHNQRLSPVTLEPRAGAAVFDGASGRLTVYASSQNPASMQKTLAGVLGLAPEQVRVRVGDVGGGFGLKAMTPPEDAVCAYTARKLGRPVRWCASRLDDFQAAAHGRDQHADAELALDRDGRILALRVRLDGNIGAYAYGAGPIINLAIGPKVITGVYQVPALDLRAQAVLTNTNIVSAYRGAGRPESIFLIERLMDRAAAELNIDPAELRRRNLIRPSQMPYRTPMGETLDCGDFPHILERALKESDWNGYEQRKRESAARGRLRGRAVSTFLEWTGAMLEEAVRLVVEADGHVRVYTALQAMGQGIETSLLQVLADTLQIDAERIEIVQGDSDVAQGFGSMASRSIYIGGSAMLTASKLAIESGRELAGKALEASAQDITYEAGRFRVAGTDLGIELGELAARQPERRIAIDTVQKVGGPSWPNGCHVCELEIDPDTGATEIVRYTTVDDVGRVINPLIAAGQVHGGIAQAVGQALLEQVVYDETGQLLTGSFMDYCIPRADDLPNFDTHTDESQPCTINPLGAKGVGELGTVGATPTVINALLDALRPLGVTDISMPATPERVWRAIGAAK
jgi:carbon-monoxide dehydrogenase large subunit